MTSLTSFAADSGLPRLIDPLELPVALAHPVVAIGNFDGVHLGHRLIFERAIALGRRLGRPVCALTFSPHPRQFFQPAAPRFELTPPAVQNRLMQEIGLDGVIVLSFDAAFASLTADAFIGDLLVGRLKVSGVVAGADFHFGKGRSGSPQVLAEAGRRHGFVTDIVDQLSGGGAVVSSTRVREALASGAVEAANAMLGYEWFISGEVIHGEKRGRDLGYPTANIRLAPGNALKHGIYAVRMRLEGKEWPAVASFGRRPTFDNGAPLLETHVFGFTGDLYGKTPDIVFVSWLRPEMKFEGIEPLIRQMDADSAAAKAILAKIPGAAKI